MLFPTLVIVFRLSTIFDFFPMENLALKTEALSNILFFYDFTTKGAGKGQPGPGMLSSGFSLSSYRATMDPHF